MVAFTTSRRINQHLDMSLTDFLDVLRNAADAELILRQQANTEWANNIKGPMTEAHKASIANVIKAAQQLIDCKHNEKEETPRD
jgi:hypothetical protein